MTAPDSLAGAAKRRSELELAMQQVEHALASPSGEAGWIADLTEQMQRMRTALANHITEVEAPGALLDAIEENAPRLQRAVEETRRHHDELTQRTDDAIAAITGHDATTADVIRIQVVELLAELTRHRHKGADLVYNAYAVDIGGY